MSFTPKADDATVQSMDQSTEDLEDWAVANGHDPTAAATRIAYAQAQREQRLAQMGTPWDGTGCDGWTRP
jgi:uncharacterized protein (DUF1015 family)